MTVFGWFGYGGSSGLVEIFREELELSGATLKTCHEYPCASVPYDYKKIHEFIDSCDVILLPARTKLQPAKSVNRLALAWSRKKPCIVSPLPAYLKYVKHGENALIAETKEDWLNAIFTLKDNPDLCNRMGISGYDVAFKYLHPHNQISKFLNLVSSKTVSDAFVQVIIPHYSNRVDYLELSIKSALQSKGISVDVLVVSSSDINPSDVSPIFKEHTNLRLIKHPHRLSFSEANNLALNNSDPRTTHYLLLNDDTILSKECLSRMVEKSIENGDNSIINPYSNCDKSWLHNDELTCLSGKSLIPNMKISDFTEDEIDSLGDGFLSNSKPTNLLISSPFCAFYCTLVPKKVVKDVGNLNTLFKNGGEDLDYCKRAERFGYLSYWLDTAMCFHFGGKTRKFSEDQNYDLHHKEDQYNNNLTRKRWGKKKRIGIWTGQAWESWDLNNYRSGGSGIGGSEYVEGCLAEAAAAAGHDVTLYCHPDQAKEQYGVTLVPWDQFKPEEEYFDIFIGSRNLNCIDSRLKAKKVFVHIHDIWLLSGKPISDYHRKRVDKFICLSPWHKKFVSEHHSLPESKIEIIPNGINYEWFDGFSFEDKLKQMEWGRLHWSSSLDRGLDNVLYLLPFVLDRCPDLKLHIFYGYHNWISAAKHRGNAKEIESIEAMQRQIESLKDHVIFHDRVNQIELSKEWRKAWMLFYPSSFHETYMLTAREAQLSYTPILCSNEGALQTTVGDYGHRVMHFPYSKTAREEYYAKIVNLYHNKENWMESAMRSNNAVIDGNYRWDRIWNIWDNLS